MCQCARYVTIQPLPHLYDNTPALVVSVGGEDWVEQFGGATAILPQSVRERLAAVLVDAEVARVRAQSAVEWICHIYDIDPDSRANLLADLTPLNGGMVPSGEPAQSE